MNSFKYTISLLIAALLYFSIAACGGNAEGETKSGGSKEPSAEETVIPEKDAAENTGTDIAIDNTPAYDLTTRDWVVPLGSLEEYVAFMKAGRPDNPDFLEARWNRGVRIKNFHPGTPDKVLRAYLLTPREIFARDYNKDVAYDANWHAIEDGQTISGPHLVCRMTEYLDIKPEHKVLEIGTGSGYHSALMAQLANKVYSIEIKQNLASVTDGIYESLETDYPEYKNVTRKNEDGYYGWEEYAPFDRIVVTCGIDHIPPPLLKQLKTGGCMVIPVGPMAGQQVILKVSKLLDEEGNIILEREDIYGGKITEHFVPFTAADGSWHSQPER